MTIVVGLDQHRGQITAEWIETETGEIERARIAPAHRAPVRRFLHRFDGADLDVALEATTGWRFVVEEVRAIGGRAHLAEPAETAARRGPKKRAKSDRADARHLRELLMIARLPESWIPPDHLLDLRARVTYSCRHPLGVDGPERPSGRNAPPSGITPSTIMSPTRRPAGSWTEIRPGARAHHTHPSNRAHAPPTTNDLNRTNPDAALDEAVPAQIRRSAA